MIAQTNAAVWRAVLAVRIERTPATLAELRAALERRRRARAKISAETL